MFQVKRVSKPYLLMRGWWRIKFGFCPLCYSSPPSPSCVICVGDYSYGDDAGPVKRADWWRHYKRMINML